ncbi:MAG: GxxExxY protein [Candidatus Acidiferrales bacterium]
MEEAQVLTYLRVSGRRIGLLMSFNSRLLKEGIKRYIV